MTLHRRLAAASGLVSVALLVGAPNAALAFALPHTGSGNGGSGSSSSGSGSSGRGSSSSGHGGPSSNHSGSGSTAGGPSSSHNGSSSGNNGSSSGHSSGSSSTNSGSTSGGSSTGSSSSSSSSSDSSSSGTGGSTPSKTRPQNPLAALQGQISRAAKQVAGAITDGTPDGTDSDDTPKSGKGSHSGTSRHTHKKPTTEAGTTVGTDATSTPSDTTTTTTTNVTKPTTTKTSLPKLAATVPLTALDFIKTETAVIAAAIPLPGMSALPAIADAVITPLQQAVNGLASAASGLPFMQIDLAQAGTVPTQLSANRFQRSGPAAGTKPKSAGPDPLTRGSGAAEAPVLPPKSPTDQAKRDQIFSASNHFSNEQEFRPGYPDYLRAAGMSEVAAVAVPGFAGILTITCAGGLLGYRQARAGRATAPSRAARFVG